MRPCEDAHLEARRTSGELGRLVRRGGQVRTVWRSVLLEVSRIPARRSNSRRQTSSSPRFSFLSFSTSSHRTPTAHVCNPPPISLTPQQLVTKSLISSAFPVASSSTLASCSTPPPKRKRKALSPAIELLRIQQGAVPGRGEVSERQDRFHLRLGVDLEGKIVGREDAGEADEESTGKEGEKGMYFRKASKPSLLGIV